jgi:hypothetical protein
MVLNRITTTGLLLLALLPACMNPTEVRAGGDDAARLIRGVEHVLSDVGRLRPIHEIDYSNLTRRLGEALHLMDSPGVPWMMVSLSDTPGSPRVQVFQTLNSGTARAAALAPTSKEREQWLRTRLAIMLKMVRDPVSQKAFSESREAGDGTEHVAIRMIELNDLPAVRRHLGESGFLKPTEWGVMYGITWHDDPGSVRLAGDSVLLDASVLHRLGVDFKVEGSRVVFARPSRRAVIPIAASATTSPRSARRDSGGRLWIPVTELERQKALGVYICKVGQLVQIRPNGPWGSTD